MWVLAQITFTEILKKVFGPTPWKNPDYAPELHLVWFTRKSQKKQTNNQISCSRKSTKACRHFSIILYGMVPSSDRRIPLRFKFDFKHPCQSVSLVCEVISTYISIFNEFIIPCQCLIVLN